VKQILMDWGNSRLKWRCGNDLRVVPNHEDWPESWSSILSGSHVILASVRSDEQNRKLLERLEQAGVNRVTQAKSERQWHQLINGYRDVSQMGVDRWLAMIAAWSRQQKPWMVVDAGTAVTLDWIDGRGRHLGGHIVPGLYAQVATLGQSTARARASLASSPPQEHPARPGASTEEAILNGAVSMLTTYVAAQWHSFRERFPEAGCLLGGGDASLLRSAVADAVLEPQLVLSGLAARYPEPENCEEPSC
jgi:type III pantothenate kinase